MLNIGDKVKVLEPFDRDFQEVYIIEDIVMHDDGQVVCILEIAGGFDPKFLRKVE